MCKREERLKYDVAVAEGVTFDTVPIILKRATIRGWPVGSARDCGDTVKFSRDQGIRCIIEK